MLPGRLQRLDPDRYDGIHRLDVIRLDDSAFYLGFFSFYYYLYDWQVYRVTR